MKNKTFLITGAAQGIGRAIAGNLLARGANVVAIDLDREGLDSLAATAPDRILALKGSVADPAFAQTAVQESVERFGALHGLVNNAGVVRAGMLEKLSIENWQQVIDVHLSGSFYFLQAVGGHMMERAKAGEAAPGAIVNISSDAGRRGTIGQVNYGAAKAGVFGLTMCAAREWGKHGIRVNTVCFGIVETPMTETIRGEKFAGTYLAQIPLGRWASADEVAKPVCFLLGDDASYITGQHLSVNGGYTIGL